MEKENEVHVFENQVAGCHDGKLSAMLRDDNNHLLKPYKALSNTTYGNELEEGSDEIVPVSPNELEFYNYLQSSNDPSIKELVSLVPKFYGSRTVNGIDHLVLEDITQGMKYPCVADVKLGKNRNYPGRMQEKIDRAKLKYPSVADCGFSIAGMKIYDGKTGVIVTKLSPPKTSALTTGEVFEYLMSYFKNGTSSGNIIVDSVMGKMRKIQAWASEQHQFLFIGSSILIAYDAAHLLKHDKDEETEETSSETCSTVHARVKMIDFAHVFYSKDEHDQNYLDALNYLTNFIVKLKR